MSWIKRNLLFVIGGLVAAGLLGWAGFYSYSRWKLNADAREQVNAQYEELKRLNKLNPHPGNNKVDNITLAREHKDSLTNVLVRVAKRFVPILPIPPGETVTSEEFASGLRRTIDQLQRDAANAGVVLPPTYSYSFEAQRRLVRFASGSLAPLSVQLGEVKAICDVLNSAKINSLDSIRRERVSADDLNGPVTDYLDTPAQTNDLAVMTPYEISFRCFSPELAEVIAGFASSPHSIVVKTVNVEPAPAVIGLGMDAETIAATPYPYYAPPPGPVTGPGAVGVPRFRGEDDMRLGAPGMGRPPAPVYATPAAPSAGRPGGLQPFINEKQLRVTLLLEIVKLLPKQQE